MKRSTVLALIALAILTVGFIAGAHPLVDHFGQTASSGIGAFGSKWIHTDTSGTMYDLWGESASSSGRGIYGRTSALSGLNFGVYGETSSSGGRAVAGFANSSSGTSHGVYGTANGANQSSGVWGYNSRTSGDTRGVQGGVRSVNGLGVYGYVTGNDGDNAVGVYGQNAALTGMGIGVRGFNATNNGWAGSFSSADGNGVLIDSPSGSDGLIVYGGSKSAAVPTSSGDRLLYNEESTEIWFTDYGFGVLKDGVAVVSIDQIFAETVNLREPYHVFLQAYGDTEIYVSKRSATSFEVTARSGETIGDIEFSYRIVAKRVGYETTRLELAPWVTEESPYYVQPTPPAPPPDPEEEPTSQE